MTVTRVLVDTEISDHDEVIAVVVLEVLDRNLHDPVRVPRLGPLGILVLRQPEQHHGRYTEILQFSNFLTKRFARVLHLARQRRDRDRRLSALVHEQGCD